MCVTLLTSYYLLRFSIAPNSQKSQEYIPLMTVKNCGFPGIIFMGLVSQISCTELKLARPVLEALSKRNSRPTVTTIFQFPQKKGSEAF